MINQKDDGFLIAMLCILSFFALIGVFITFYLFAESDQGQQQQHIPIAEYANDQAFNNDYKRLADMDQQLTKRFEVFDKYPVSQLVVEKKGVNTALNTLIFFRKRIADPELHFKGCLKTAHDNLIDNTSDWITYATSVVSVASKNEKNTGISKEQQHLSELRDDMMLQRENYQNELNTCMSEGVSAEVVNKLYALDESFESNFTTFSSEVFVNQADVSIREVGKQKIDSELEKLISVKNKAVQAQFTGCRKKVNNVFIHYADTHIAYVSALAMLAKKFDEADRPQDLAKILDTARLSHQAFEKQLQSCVQKRLAVGE